MGTRTISAYNNGNSGDLKTGGTFSYSSNTTHSGVVDSSLYDVTSATITLPVKYCDTQYSFYFDIYIGGTKVAETVKLWSEYDDLLVGSSQPTVTRTYDLEAISSDILSATGTIKLKVYNNGSDGSVTINFRSGTATVEVNYSAKTSAPGTPTNLSLSKSSVGPSESVTLSWKEPSKGNNNSIKGYKIYRSTSSSGSFTQISTKTTDTSSLSISVTAPSTNGSSYYYKVKAIGTTSGYTEGGTSSASGALTCNYSAPGAPTNFKINDSNTNLFVTENDALSITWTNTTSTGTNNSIEGYTIERSTTETSGFTSLKTSATSPYSTAPNTSGSSYYYRMYTQGKYGTSSITNTLKVTSISDPSSPTINPSSYNTTVKSNITLTWAAPSAITGATYTYKIAYTYNGKQTVLENNYNQTSYTFNINNIAENGTFTLNVATVAKSTNGGSLTSGYANTSTITRAPSFKIPTNFWLHCYDPDNTDTNGKTGLQLYGHNKVYLQWAALSETGNSFTYTLKYRKTNDSSWTEVFSKTTTTSTTISLANREGGDSFIFKVDVIDSYGSEQSSEYPSTFTKIKIPTLESLAVKNVKYPSGNISYNWNFSDNSNGKLKCEGFLYYGNDYVTLFSETYDTGNTQKTVTKGFNYNLKTSDTSSVVKDNLYNSLYATVIRNKNCYPEGKIKIKLSSVNFPECYKEEWKDFTYDYVTSITVGALSFAKISERNYYNPEDKVKILFTPATFYDAAGGSTGATISYKLEGNGGSWTNFTKESDGKFSCEDIAPKANEDLPITYTLTAFAQYADIDKTYIYNSTDNKSDSNKINIARWNENDSIYLSSVQKEGTKVSGSLIMSGSLCSSIKYGNIKTITYSLINAGTGDIIISNQSLPIIYSNNLISKSFEFTYSVEGNLSVYAEVIFTNTSNKEIKKVTTAYLLRTAGVPLAIRKGRIGINVNSSSFINENDTLKNSALYIAADSDVAPILELSASSNAKNPNFISFLKGETNYGSIFLNESDSLLHCDKWYYPVTKVNGKTGDITLTASDVEARSNTWMPTAGSGISISGETITNSGIRTLTATTGDNNGQIKLTINGTPTNISVKGFSTNYLPLSGGTITKSTSIADNGYAGINFKVTQTDNNVSASAYIRAYDDHDTSGYGVNFVIGATGNMILGGGESANSCYTTDLKDNTGENLYLTADGTIYFYSNCNTYADHKTSYIDKTGQFYSEGIRGNAIRYGSTTPTTNLAVGQIWLKPKG